MIKAVIFDFDGVVIDTEQMWEACKDEVMPRLVGSEIASKIGSTIGLSLDLMYEKAIGYGAKISREAFIKPFFNQAGRIYSQAPLTPGLEQLVKLLTQLNIPIGIVSVSPRKWLDIALSRLPFKDKTKVIISLYGRSDLRSKPFPDGYIEAMKELNSNPEETIILEDSNAGIASAKAAGAYVIAFRQNLVPGFKQTEKADAVAENIQDVIKIVQNFTSFS